MTDPRHRPSSKGWAADQIDRRRARQAARGAKKAEKEARKAAYSPLPPASGQQASPAAPADVSRPPLPPGDHHLPSDETRHTAGIAGQSGGEAQAPLSRQAYQQPAQQQVPQAPPGKLPPAPYPVPGWYYHEGGPPPQAPPERASEPARYVVLEAREVHFRPAVMVLGTIGAAVAGFFACFMLVNWASRTGSVPLEKAVWLWLAYLLLVAIQVTGMLVTQRRRNKKSGKQRIEVQDNEIGDSLIHFIPALARSSPHLSSGEKPEDSAGRPTFIRQAKRTHYISWLMPAILYALISGFLLWQVIGPFGKQLGSKPWPAAILLVVPILAGALALQMLVRQYTLWALKDVKFTRIRYFPAFFWWIPESNPSVFNHQIDSSKTRVGALGKLLGFGTLVVDTSAEKDADFHKIRFIPNVEGSNEAIDEMVLKVRRISY